MSEIFKIQIPLSTNLESPMALIYNQDRSIEVFVPCSPSLLKFLDGKVKQYAYGNVIDGDVAIEKEAPWQTW